MLTTCNPSALWHLLLFTIQVAQAPPISRLSNEVPRPPVLGKTTRPILFCSTALTCPFLYSTPDMRISYKLLVESGGVLHWVCGPKPKGISIISSWVSAYQCIYIVTFISLDFSVYESITNSNRPFTQTGRETFLFPVTFDSDGWPVFNHGLPLSTEITGVELPDKAHRSTFCDDFSTSSSSTFDNSYYFLRTPYKPFHSLTTRPGFLRLLANAYALGDRDSPALILRKQRSYAERFETALDFMPNSNLTEAGATVFYGDFAHNDIGVMGGADGDGERFIVTRLTRPAEQVGPWALTTTNSTVTTVSFSVFI